MKYTVSPRMGLYDVLFEGAALRTFLTQASAETYAAALNHDHHQAEKIRNAQ